MKDRSPSKTAEREIRGICLIGGTGRCGTTVLAEAFARHPQVTRPAGWRFLVDPDGLLDFYATAAQGWTPYVFDFRVRRLERVLRAVAHQHPLAKPFRALEKTGILRRLPVNLRPRYASVNATASCPGFERRAADLISRLAAFRYAGYWVGQGPPHRNRMYYGVFPDRQTLAEILRDFLYGVIGESLQHQGADFYLEKNIWNILWFDRILELLPEARLVHIYRDPRDVVASFVRQPWMPDDPVQCARVVRDLLARWSAVRQTVPPDRCLDVSLEALVRGPESTLREVCSFWRVPWHASLLETDLSHAHVNRWRRDLAPSVAARVQHELRAEIEAFGYEHNDVKPDAGA